MERIVFYTFGVLHELQGHFKVRLFGDIRSAGFEAAERTHECIEKLGRDGHRVLLRSGQVSCVSVNCR